MTEAKTYNKDAVPAETAGAAMKVEEPTAVYAGNGGQNPENLVVPPQNLSECGTTARQQLAGGHLGDYIVEQVTKKVSASNQALYEKFSGELRQQNKEFNAAMRQQNDKFIEAMRQQNDKFIESMRQQNDKFIAAMRQQNDKFNNKFAQIHRDINIHNRWLIGGLIALVIAVLLS